MSARRRCLLVVAARVVRAHRRTQNGGRASAAHANKAAKAFLTIRGMVFGLLRTQLDHQSPRFARDSAGSDTRDRGACPWQRQCETFGRLSFRPSVRSFVGQFTQNKTKIPEWESMPGVRSFVRSFVRPSFLPPARSFVGRFTRNKNKNPRMGIHCGDARTAFVRSFVCSFVCPSVPSFIGRFA